MPAGKVGRRIQRSWSVIWDGGRGWVLLTVSLGWTMTLGARIVYPALLPSFRLEFEFGYTTAGVLIGLVWASYGLLQFPGGLLADVTTHRTALVTGTVVTGIGVLAVVASPVLGSFVVATVLLGAGTGVYGPSRVAVLSHTYPDHDSTAIGVSQAAGNVGNAVLPVVAGILSAYAGWRFGFGFLAPLLALVTLGLWLAVPGTASTRLSSIAIRPLLTRTRSALVTRPVYSGTALLLLVMFVYQSLTGFLPTYLVDEKELSSATATSLYGGFFATAVGMQLAAGVLADRIGVRRVIVLFAGLSVPGFLTLFVVDGLALLVGGVVLLSCLLGCFPPVHAYTVSTVPEAAQGTGYGAIRTVYIGCGAGGPVITGLVADAISFPAAILTLGVIVTGIVILGSLLPLPGDP